MSKHTPGPWSFDGPPDNIIVWSGPDDRVCFMTSDGAAKANARLIAAAPEMLDALRDAAKAMANTGGIDPPVLATVRAAIRKAESRS